MARPVPIQRQQPVHLPSPELLPAPESPDSEEKPHKKENISKLALAALGVVFGDIGTSPLYAVRECFDPAQGIPLSNENVFGVLSLIFWALTLVVSIKYLAFILRADNRGEGGIMALIALILPPRGQTGSKSRVRAVFLGLFGAALLYGDGVITPAISVLSAIEGLKVATPAFDPVVVPLTVVILLGLFSVQHRGTAKIGAIFGPATLIWFITIAAIGLPWIMRHPEILLALNPVHATDFFFRNGVSGFLILSAVVLCITGAEALYADMGHFGKVPIRLGWFAIVLPSLLINYFGQGALILELGADAIRNPFYGLISGWKLYPLVIIAAIATIIASQALISGAYSLTQQAIQLGYLPRTRIAHTSEEKAGQIYIPQVNQFLMIGCIALVVAFQHSSNLAGAYGVAVTGTMIITSILYYSVARGNWRWSLLSSAGVVGIFLLVDFAFFSANIRKLFQGGLIPIAIALVLFTIMATWKRGRDLAAKFMVSMAMPIQDFLGMIPRKKPPRVPGTAVFMSMTEDIAPAVLLHHFRHNRVLHDRVILLSIVTQNEPIVDDFEKVKVKELPQGFVKVKARYGFMETPDISEILIFCLGAGLSLDINELSFYLGRETFLTTGESGLSDWRKKLFVILSRNARPATDFFGIPPDQVIELGSQVEI